MNALATTLAAELPENVPTLSDFGHDPLWLILLKTVGAFAILVIIVILMIWWERRLIGFMQNRPGPNRTGPGGILQALMDGVKLAFKEEVIPKMADKPVYWVAPVVIAFPAFMAFSVIPIGPMVSIFGEQTPLQLTDTPVGVLVVLACASVGAYGLILAGWSSGSAYPLIGGLRSTAQIISYEIAMGLAIVGVILWAGTISTSEIVAAQIIRPWFFILLPISCILYLIAMVGETNRAPFDLAEAESELVGGFHTEYSSMKFAMFFLAEYVNMVTVSALATTMFFGGWRAPFPLNLFDWANDGWWPMLWWLLKTCLILSCFIWLRGALPRLRYDQFMKLGWKVMIPIALIWIMFISVIRTGMYANGDKMPMWGWIATGIFTALVLGVIVWYVWLRKEPEVPNINANPAFPIPPMNLIVPPSGRVGDTRGPRGRVGAKAGKAALAAKENRNG